MVKILIYILVFILGSSLISFLKFLPDKSGNYLFATGEESSPVASTKEVVVENTPPPISRNPFVSVPYGRMEMPAVKSETIPKSRGVGKREDIVKHLKLKGILLDEEYPVALIGNRIVKVGDSIGEFVVKDITISGIILLKGDQAIQLSVE